MDSIPERGELPAPASGAQRFRKVMPWRGQLADSEQVRRFGERRGNGKGVWGGGTLDRGVRAWGFPGGRECHGLGVGFERLGRRQDTSRLAEEGNQLVLAVRMANPSAMLWAKA